MVLDGALAAPTVGVPAHQLMLSAPGRFERRQEEEVAGSTAPSFGPALCPLPIHSQSDGPPVESSVTRHRVARLLWIDRLAG